MSALDVALGRARPAKSKKKGRKKSKALAVSTEYSLLLTATLCLLAFGAVMVFSASSTTQVLQNGGLADSAYYLQRTLAVGAIGLVVMHFTARFSRLAAIAAMAANWLDCVSLPPKPPPMRRTCTVTALEGTPSAWPTMCWTSLGCWVEDQTVTSSSSPGMASAMWPSR